MIDKNWGHGYYGCAGCCGYETPGLIPNPMPGAIGTGANNTAQAHDMCTDSWVDVTSETAGWTSTNSGIVSIANAYSNFVSVGSVTGSGYVQLPQQLARLGCPVTGFEPQNNQNSVCAVPTNLKQLSATDIGGGNLQFKYAYSSSTGNLNDLAGCTVSEIVNYPGTENPYVWPSPPFPSKTSNPNPSIGPTPAISGPAGVFVDTHKLPSTNFPVPSSSGSFTATQYYRYSCSCAANGSYQNIDGPLSIVRSVYSAEAFTARSSSKEPEISMYRHLLDFLLLTVGSMALLVNGQSGSGERGLTIEYKLASTSTALHEPILMTVTISNHLGTDAQVDLGQDRKEAFEVSVEQPDHKISDAKLPLHEGMSVVGTVGIAPGSSYAETLVLNQWQAFSQVGLYKIRVRLVRPRGAEESRLPEGLGSWADLPPLQITPADPTRLAAICQDLKATLETSSSYPEVAEAALELSYVEDPIAVPYLQDMAFLRYGALASLSANGLERVGGPSAVNALILLGKNSNVAISSPARFSLLQLEQATSDPATRETIKNALAEYLHD